MSEIREKIENELKTVKSLCETMEHAIKTQIDKGLDKVDTHELYEAVDIYKDMSEVKKNIIEGCYKMYILDQMEGHGEDEEGAEDGEERRYYRGQRRNPRTGRYMSSMGRRGYEEMMPYEEYHPLEYYRDMDRWDNRMYYADKMMPSEYMMHNGNRGYSEGQSGARGSDGASGSQSNGNSGNRGYSEGFSDGQSRGYEEGNRRGYEDGNREGYERGYSEGERRGRSEGEQNGRSSQSRSERARRGYEESQAMNSNTTQDGKEKRMRELNSYMDELTDDMKSLVANMGTEEKTMLKQKMAKLNSLV